MQIAVWCQSQPLFQRIQGGTNRSSAKLRTQSSRSSRCFNRGKQRRRKLWCQTWSIGSLPHVQSSIIKCSFLTLKGNSNSRQTRIMPPTQTISAKCLRRRSPKSESESVAFEGVSTLQRLKGIILSFSTIFTVLAQNYRTTSYSIYPIIYPKNFQINTNF